MNEHPAAEPGQVTTPATPAAEKPAKAPHKAKAKPAAKSAKAAPTKKAPVAAKVLKPAVSKKSAPAKTGIKSAKKTPVVAAKTPSAKRGASSAVKAHGGKKMSNKAVSIDTKVTVNVGGRNLEFTLIEAESLSRELDHLFKRVQTGAQRK